MHIFYSPKHQHHNPPMEFLDGRCIPFTENPRRAEIIIDAIRGAGIGPIIEPDDLGLDAILGVHSADYVEHFRTIFQRWSEISVEPAALPSTLPRPGFDRLSPSPYAAIGYYSFDLSAPVADGTYEGAVVSAHCAVAGARAVREGERAVYALCRPPGHHAYSNLMGGFCYFNNAAIAAHELTQGGKRVALIDIDVHHGNGTQAIFYDREDVLFISLHGHPDWEYPYFVGYADERGEGAGVGYNLNYPLDKGTTDAQYLEVLDDSISHIRNFAPDYLVISAGFDTFDGDPLGKFKISTPGYQEIGARLASLDLPTLAIQEGGYMQAKLGENVVSFLRGLRA
jgi:acetoin utilization deacetylase AcuC-like enzyme